MNKIPPGAISTYISIFPRNTLLLFWPELGKKLSCVFIPCNMDANEPQFKQEIQQVSGIQISSGFPFMPVFINLECYSGWPIPFL